MRKTQTGFRAILSDGTKVICMFENEMKDGKRMISCSRLQEDALILIDTKSEDEWEWKCPPEPLQK